MSNDFKVGDEVGHRFQDLGTGIVTSDYGDGTYLVNWTPEAIKPHEWTYELRMYGRELKLVTKNGI